MAAGAGAEEGEELRLLSAAEAGGVGAGGAPAAEKSWRLNFDGFRPPEAHQERPPRGLHHHCLGVLGTPLSLSLTRPWCFASSIYDSHPWRFIDAGLGVS
jgi:hypothetical protein